MDGKVREPKNVLPENDQQEKLGKEMEYIQSQDGRKEIMMMVTDCAHTVTDLPAERADLLVAGKKKNNNIRSNCMNTFQAGEEEAESDRIKFKDFFVRLNRCFSSFFHDQRQCQP